MKWFVCRQLTSHLGVLALCTYLICLETSATVTKIVSVGKTITLECVVIHESNKDIYWSKWKASSDSSEYIAYAGRSSRNGSFYPDFRDMHLTLNYQIIPEINVSILAITIWNITSADSSNYLCHTYNYQSNTSNDFLTYSVQVVNCACSVDSTVTCDLTGYDFRVWTSVTVYYGNHSKKLEIRNNRIVMNDMGLMHDIVNNDVGILVTSTQFSLTEIINVSCTISPPVHSSSPSTSPQSPTPPSKPSETTLDKSTVAITQSLPSCQKKPCTPKDKPSIFANDDLENRSSADLLFPSTFLSPKATSLDPMKVTLPRGGNIFRTIALLSVFLDLKSTSIYLALLLGITMIIAFLCTKTLKFKTISNKLHAPGVQNDNSEPLYNGSTVSHPVSSEKSPALFLPDSKNNRMSPGVVIFNQALSQNQTDTACSDDLQSTGNYESLVDDALYESCEFYQPDDLRFANLVSKNVHISLDSLLQDNNMTLEENAYEGLHVYSTLNVDCERAVCRKEA